MKEGENRNASGLIQNEAVDDLGKSSVVGVLGDGNQRHWKGDSEKVGKSQRCTWVKNSLNLSTI